MANSGDGVLQRACLLRGGVMGFERAEHSTVGFAAAAARSARVAGGSRDASERDSGLESSHRAPLPSVSPLLAYPPTTTIAGGLLKMVAVCAERASASGVPL